MRTKPASGHVILQSYFYYKQLGYADSNQFKILSTKLMQYGEFNLEQSLNFPMTLYCIPQARFFLLSILILIIT